MRIISGQYRNRALTSPKGKNVRPTSEKLRACLFNICQNVIENSSFLDIFAGSGAMGLEALSRHAKQVTFIENDRLAIACIRENIELLEVKNLCELLVGDAFKVLQQLEKKSHRFDLIYADPPYKEMIDGVPLNQKILAYIDEHSLLADTGQLFLEDSTKNEKLMFEMDKQLKSLYLKSSRRFGTSLLRHYIWVKT